MIKTQEYELSAFITNLGKYNEGYLVGKFIRLPIPSEELKEALNDIGIDEYYEEYFFTDFDGTYPSAVYDSLNEYSSIKELNKIALALEKVCGTGEQEMFEAFLEHNGGDIFSAAANAIEGNGWKIPATDYVELAEYFIDLCGGIDKVPRSTIEYYFDYESFGRDISLEYYLGDDMPETAAEYWCNDENASYSDIAEAIINECGFDSVNNKGAYFDYNGFGKAIFDEGNYVFAEDGIIDCGDYDDGIGKDFEKELENELEEKGDEAR